MPRRIVLRPVRRAVAGRARLAHERPDKRPESLHELLRPRVTQQRPKDVTAAMDLALTASGLDQVKVRHRPRLLSDNGSSYIAGDPAEWLEDQGMTHIRRAPRPPQGKIERWHQTLKNRILLEHWPASRERIHL